MQRLSLSVQIALAGMITEEKMTIVEI